MPHPKPQKYFLKKKNSKEKSLVELNCLNAIISPSSDALIHVVHKMASSGWLCIHFVSLYLMPPLFWIDVFLWSHSSSTNTSDLEETGDRQVETLSKWGWNCPNAIENCCLSMSHLAGIYLFQRISMHLQGGGWLYCLEAATETGIHESSISMELDVECVNIKGKNYLIYRCLGQEDSQTCIDNDYRSLERTLCV